MSYTVFYSWQSDTPAKEGRSFIERALETAVKAVSADVQLEEALRDELTLDKDTKGVPGSPPIFKTILDKIERASIFVADLTFCDTRHDGERRTPNPNVLIEYGYALKSVGYNQIIAVMNSAHGKPSRASLPFNLADLRYPLTYELPSGAADNDRKIERERLAKALEGALRDIFNSDEFKAKMPIPTAPTNFVATSKLRGELAPIGLLGSD